MLFYPIKTTLQNGMPILVRPVQSDDKQLLETGFELLSRQSRFLRFFRPVTKLSAKELDYYCAVDQSDHIAICALDTTQDETRPLGIARCIRARDKTDEAELAVTVIDRFQGRGIGTILLAAIAHAAITQNITKFVGTILTENDSMLNLLVKLEASSTFETPGVLSVCVPIHGDAGKYPDSPIRGAIANIYEMLDQAQNDQHI